MLLINLEMLLIDGLILSLNISLSVILGVFLSKTVWANSSAVPPVPQTANLLKLGIILYIYLGYPVSLIVFLMGYREMSKVGGNLLASVTECRHISTKSIQRGLSELFDAAHIPLIHVSCLLSGQAAWAVRNWSPAVLWGCGTFSPQSSDCPSVCPISGLGMFALNQERNKDLPPSSSLFICPQHRDHRPGYQEEDGCYLQILRVHPCHPTPDNTYSLCAPYKPKPSLSLGGGCKSFRKIMPVKVNCRQNKRQLPSKIAFLSQAVFPFLLFLL